LLAFNTSFLVHFCYTYWVGSTTLWLENVLNFQGFSVLTPVTWDQFYLPPDTGEHIPLQPHPDQLVLDLPIPVGCKAELTWVAGFGGWHSFGYCQNTYGCYIWYYVKTRSLSCMYYMVYKYFYCIFKVLLSGMLL